MYLKGPHSVAKFFTALLVNQLPNWSENLPDCKLRPNFFFWPKFTGIFFFFIFVLLELRL